MRTNIVIDDQLMNRALRVSGFTTKTEVVDTALREFVERKERKNLQELKGSIHFYDGYDYKAAREGHTNDPG